MIRVLLAAALAAATLVGWFVLAIVRLARQLEADGTAGPRGAAADDSEVVGMPTTWRFVSGADPVRTESSVGYCGMCGAWYIPGGLHVCSPRATYTGSATWRTN